MLSDDNQRNKATALTLWAALDRDPLSTVRMLDHVKRWQGPAPIGARDSGAEIVEALFVPLRAAVRHLHRTTHILMGGSSSAREVGGGDGACWVAGTGVYTGRGVGAVFGIPIAGLDVRLRWGEFLRFDQNGNITQAQTIWDFVDLCDLIGRPLLPTPRGVAQVFPAPTAFDGAQAKPQDLRETKTTLQLGRDLIFGGLNTYDQTDLTSMGMARFFHPDVRWYGPGGIGACLSLRDFEVLHQRPWLEAFPDRKVKHLESLFAEGQMLAASGPMGVVATQMGPYLGHAPSGAHIEVSGLDFWLRTGDRFSENWVFVDMVDLFAQMGVDLLACRRERMI